MPFVIIAEAEYILETPKLAAAPVPTLKTPIALQATRQFEMTGALDLLFQGF